MNSITEYSTFGVKARQSIFFQLVGIYLTISNNPMISIACYYSFFFNQHRAKFIDGFITQWVFNRSFATQLSYSGRFIKAAKSIGGNSNQLCTSKFFPEKTRCPMIEIPMLLTTGSGGKIIVFIRSKFISTVILSIHLPH